MKESFIERHLDATRIRHHADARDVLCVGEDNPLSTRPEYALYCEPPNCAGNRLQSKIMGLGQRTYLSLWRSNLCVGGWDRRMAEDRASQLVGNAAPWSIVVMLGRKVCDAFESVTRRQGLGAMMTVSALSGVELAVSLGVRDATPQNAYFVALPHPSGRNTLWNSADLVVQARDLLRDVAPHVPWGEIDR